MIIRVRTLIVTALVAVAGVGAALTPDLSIDRAPATTALSIDAAPITPDLQFS